MADTFAEMKKYNQKRLQNKNAIKTKMQSKIIAKQ